MNLSSIHIARSAACLAATWLVAGSLLGAQPARAAEQQIPSQPGKYQFDRTISREVLENYLSRSITMEGLLNGRGDLDDNIRMLKSIGRQVHRTQPLPVGRRGQSAAAISSGPKQQVPKVHAADPDMILQACIFEIVTTQVDQVPVPDWAFAALGQPVEKRNFRYADMLYPNGRFKDHWRAGPVGPGREPAGNQALVLLPGGVVHRRGLRSDPPRADGTDEPQRPQSGSLFPGARPDPVLCRQARPPAHGAAAIPTSPAAAWCATDNC